jgi:hypothetical protein
MQWLLAPIRFVNRLPQAIASLTLAARIALLVGVFQVVVVLLAVVVLLVGDEQVFEAWWQPGKLLMLAVLLVLTPLLVYQAARLWLDRDASRWPDILEAWQSGVAELRRQGISLTDVPLFLVIGACSDDQEKRLLDDAPCELPVRASPAGSAALHLFGGPDAVFVCLATSSHVSDLARRGVGRGIESRPSPVAASPAATGNDVRGTMAVVLPAEAAAASPAPEPSAAAAPAVAASFPAADINATIQIDAVAAAVTAATVGKRPPAVSAADREIMTQRLKYVCDLVRRERGNLAPLNGLLAVVPAAFLLAEGSNGQSLGRALADDLVGVRDGMGLRAPVTVLIAGFEDDKGFAELIRRVPAAERQSRLGQRFPIGVAPSYEQLGTVATRACGMAEDLVLGRILRTKSVLDEPGNRHLVGLAARLRSEFSGRLATLLRRAFATPEGESTETTPLLSGCYLAAAGASAETRGFVRGVLEKLLDSQGDLEWTEAAEDLDRAAGRTAAVLWILSGLVRGSLATAIALKAWGVL